MLLPGQQVGDHCVRAGLTRSTSFPRAAREGGDVENSGVMKRGQSGRQ